MKGRLSFFALALLLVLQNSGAARAGGGNWQYVLNLLNNKRSDAGKDPVSVPRPEDIDMDAVLAIRAGTEDILPDYGFTDLADALNCAGYPQDTWSEGFDCKGEIERILFMMNVTYRDIREEIRYFSLGKDSGTAPGQLCGWATMEEAYAAALSGPDILRCLGASRLLGGGLRATGGGSV